MDTAIIHELNNQSSDMVILEHSQDEHQEPLGTKPIVKLVLTKDASQKKRVDEIKLRKLRKKYQKL